MGEWFIRPLGDRAGWSLFLPAARARAEPGQYLCARCGAPLVACYRCGWPATCGDPWCELCQPDG